uniref:Uncharacterized protein LOC114348935 n=1 Tax=Diabrotica virgifera virgifera TaxID=50390 RepID=A0A6P7HHR5_DIAVI
MSWDNILYENFIDNKVRIFNDMLVSLFDKHAPYVESRITKPPAPWLTPTIQNMMKTRNAALAKYKKTRNVLDYSYYKDLRNAVTNAVRLEKSGYLNYRSSSSNKKDLWKTMRIFKIVNKPVIEIPQELKDPISINNYFTSVFSPVNCCPETTQWYQSNIFNPDIIFSFKMATIDEIKSLILGLKSDAVGCDNISAKMLQLSLSITAPYITHIINSCLE